MSMISLFLIFFCSYVLAAETNYTNQSKRGAPEPGGWTGIQNPHGYGGQSRLITSDSKELKLPPFDLAHGGLYAGIEYGRAPAIPFPGGNILKTIPVYITKHVLLEKPIPIPQPVYIEKPFHVPVPVEKIIREPVPVPVPAVPDPLKRAIPMPVKGPAAMPVQQPYPMPVQQPYPMPVQQPYPMPVQQPYPIPAKQAFPGPVPVPVPNSAPAPPIAFAPPACDAGGYGGGHFYPPLPPVPAHFVHSFGAGFVQGFGHGFGHGLGHNYGHGHGYGYPPLPFAPDYGHGRENKKPSNN